MSVLGVQGGAERGRDAGALRSYAVTTLVDHLVRAGRRDAVHQLLSKEGSEGSAWYELKQRADDDRGYERDLGRAWQFADAQFHDASDGPQRARAIAWQVRYALISASLEDRSDRLTPEELRRHVVNGEWSMSRARAAAARASDPTVRAQMFAELIGAGTDSDIRNVIADGLGDASRGLVLAAVTERLPPGALAWVITAARAFGGQDALADALAAAAPRLPANDVEPLLREAMSLTSHHARARAVLALAARAPTRLADKVVLESGLLDDDEAALALVEAQASALSPAAAERSLEVLRRLPASARRTDAAVVLLDAVPLNHRNHALQAERGAARRIRALDKRAAALAMLGLSAEAVEAAGEINPAHRAATIVAIAPHLEPAFARKAMDALKEIESPTARGEALVALAPMVEPSSALAVLKMVENVRPEKAKARVLAILAPRLPEARLSYALRLALRFRDLRVRGVVVAALEPRLSDRHRATGLYRRRAGSTSGIDVEAALREWSTPSTTRRAPPARRAPSPIVPETVDGHGAGSRGAERLDGPGLRQRLIETIRSDQSDYTALQDWLVKTLSSGNGHPLDDRTVYDLKERLAAAVRDGSASHRYETLKGKWAETTLRRHLRAQVVSRLVELDDPRVLAALDLADPVTVRTALHLGLDIAESRESDDGLFEERDNESPTLPDVVPVFAHHGRLGEVIDAARDLKGPYRRAEALVAVLPHLAAHERTAIAAEVLASVIAACRGRSPRMWWKRLDVLEPLAPELDDPGTKDMAAELRRLGTRVDASLPPGDSRRAIIIESQFLLMLHAAPPMAAMLAVDGLTAAARVRSEVVRAAVLDAFAPRLPATALERAAATARTLSSRRRAVALATLARRAAEIRATRKASNLIEEIARLSDLFADPKISALVGQHASLLTPTALSAVWCPEEREGLLHNRNGASRDDVLRTLENVSTVLTLLGGPETTDAVGETRDIITRWWP